MVKRMEVDVSWMRRLTLAATFVTCLAAIILIFAGCGQNGLAPTANNDSLGSITTADSQLEHLIGGGGGDDGDQPEQLLGFFFDLLGNIVSIGSDGGLIELELGDLSSVLIVPPGALEYTVAIELRAVQVNTPWGVATVYDCSPDGLEFNIPATLTQECHDPDGTVKTLWWYNPNKSRWQVEGTAEVQNGSVSFEIHHFSKYGIN